MANHTVTTNQIAPGTRVTMQGQLDEFTYYLNHLLEGEKLQEQIQRQKAAGWKFPKTNPRSEFHIVDPRPVDGTDMTNENVKNLLTYLKESKVYTKDGVTRLECVKSGKVPLMGVLISENPYKVQKVNPTGNLEAGQTVRVEFSCFKTDKGNNGVAVNTVVFLEEPKEKTSLEGWIMDDAAPAAPATPAAPASTPAPAAAPAQDIPAGFEPAVDEDIPW